jgi:hypothetical protein
MTALNKFLGLTVAVLTWGTLGGEAVAQSHAYINYTRNSAESHVFVQQSVDGEYGRYTSTGSVTGEDGVARPLTQAQYWKGYGIGTTLGLELMKFIQFVGGHTFVNMRTKNDALESLNGSRLHGGLRAVFSAPVANLELGMGLQGSRLDYQKQLENASFYGSGTYYSLGLNYFMSSQVSVYYEAKMAKEHLVESGGSSSMDAIDTNMTLMGLGFRIWL